MSQQNLNLRTNLSVTIPNDFIPHSFVGSYIVSEVNSTKKIMQTRLLKLYPFKIKINQKKKRTHQALLRSYNRRGVDSAFCIQGFPLPFFCVPYVSFESQIGQWIRLLTSTSLLYGYA